MFFVTLIGEALLIVLGAILMIPLILGLLFLILICIFGGESKKKDEKEIKKEIKDKSCVELYFLGLLLALFSIILMLVDPLYSAFTVTSEIKCFKLLKKLGGFENSTHEKVHN